jgi:hypothetical protein
VWAIPYTETTVIVDVIDAHTNLLVWRGYDTDTLNLDNVLSSFYHDAKKVNEQRES